MKKIANEDLGRLTAMEYLKTEKLPIVVVLEDIRSAHNVGSFFRTADAFGISRILLCGITPTPPSREIHKTALSSELVVEWEYFKKSLLALEKLREEGYQLIAVEQVEGAVSLEKFKPDKGTKIALLFGNEVEGVSQSAVSACDMAVEIPQVGTKHSLNVSVAGGVVLWEIFRRF